MINKKIKLFSTLISLFMVGLSFWISGCYSETNEEAMFIAMDPSHTNVDFSNDLHFRKDFNIYTYRNFYNGGGVAIGDINNDGLVDIYFTSNMGPNRLYLNKGNFQFKDITDKSGTAGTHAWSTGVSMADFNGDGYLDLYVCNSGEISGDNRANELFVNNGDLTFTEQAAEYGVANKGYSIHASFFDYDKDGDLDLYVLNNSYKAIGSFDMQTNQRPVRDSIGGDVLYRNDDGIFTDVSEEAGIFGSVIGFGLGVTTGDINMDGWPDLFISNDFFERDYLYINNGDGTFNEVLEQQMRSISAASMGADMADINNDGYPDVFVTEMLPRHDARLKTVTTFEDWNKYVHNVENDYYHQFTRNVLHLNNRDGTFSEIGRLAGIEATDWSWGALIFDMNNDGHKDLFIANGIYQDLTNQDYLKLISNRTTMRSIIRKEGVDFESLVNAIPSNAVPNYAYVNTGRDYSFENTTRDWGLGDPSFSNGSAYADLDNDGDLDLVINNVNMPASIYQNRSEKYFKDHSYIKLDLKGDNGNTFALGSKVIAVSVDKRLYYEQMPIRGFQSTVDHRLNIGLGSTKILDSLIVIWPNDQVTVKENVETNQQITLRQNEASLHLSDLTLSKPAGKPLFKEMSDSLDLDFRHIENSFVDFNRDNLVYHMRSNEGPPLAVGDVNGDGKDDFYVGGAKDMPGELFLQTNTGFKPTSEQVFENDKLSEDVDCVFFDVDNDGDLDLYVASGGNDFSSSSAALQDRLYINDGNGNFTRSPQQLPVNRNITTACVKPADYDNDGDMDLFVGERLKPFYIGVPGSGFILNNDGKGNFTDVTSQAGPELEELGMITDAVWTDIDGDGDPDLIIVGEYMPASIFLNENGQFMNITASSLPEKTHGWWHTIHPADLDGDGDIDFVLGNHGKNSRFKASGDKPVTMYVNDFDRNGMVEQIICQYNGEKSYPMVLRHDLIRQIPALENKYPKYEDYTEQTIEDIFPPEELKNALVLKCYELSTSLLINEGSNNFRMEKLPVEAQFAPVFAIHADDFNNDGITDILLGGNQYKVKPEVGRYDAGYGLLLKGTGNGEFVTVPGLQSGFKVEGEIRDIKTLTYNGETLIIVARSDDTLKVFSLTRPSSNKNSLIQ